MAEKLTDAQLIAELQKENAALKSSLEARTVHDKAVAEKMAMGLSREQSEAVIKRQKDYESTREKQIAEEKEKAAKKAKASK